MPELPEVETTVAGLDKVLPGLTIKDIWSDFPKQIHGKSFFDFKKKIVGKEILSVSRRAKNVLIHLSDNLTLRVHMKMTGHLLFDCPQSKYIHLRFFLSKNHELSLSDLRKFSRIELLQTDKIHRHEAIKKLGPEPFDPVLTHSSFVRRFRRRQNSPIKIALLDQRLIAGIGNIYGDEILWEIGVLPTRKVKDVTVDEFANILKAMRELLKRSIIHGGDSMSDYRNIHGEKGGFQKFHRAYHQTGQACQRRGCHGIIDKIKLGGRTAHFCPEHQK